MLVFFVVIYSIDFGVQTVLNVMFPYMFIYLLNVTLK